MTEIPETPETPIIGTAEVQMKQENGRKELTSGRRDISWWYQSHDVLGKKPPGSILMCFHGCTATELSQLMSRRSDILCAEMSPVGEDSAAH